MVGGIERDAERRGAGRRDGPSFRQGVGGTTLAGQCQFGFVNGSARCQVGAGDGQDIGTGIVGGAGDGGASRSFNNKIRIAQRC